jgi:haloacetate dehalogenase
MRRRRRPTGSFCSNLVPDLPEALIAGREAVWLRHFFSDWCHDPAVISGEAFDSYMRAYQAPGAARGAMADYRANAEDGAEDGAQDIADAAVKIACPVMSLCGADFLPSARCSTCRRSRGNGAGNLVTHAIPQQP